MGTSPVNTRVTSSPFSLFVDTTNSTGNVSARKARARKRCRGGEAELVSVHAHQIRNAAENGGVRRKHGTEQHQRRQHAPHDSRNRGTRQRVQDTEQESPLESAVQLARFRHVLERERVETAQLLVVCTSRHKALDEDPQSAQMEGQTLQELNSQFRGPRNRAEHGHNADAAQPGNIRHSEQHAELWRKVNIARQTEQQKERTCLFDPLRARLVEKLHEPADHLRWSHARATR